MNPKQTSLLSSVSFSFRHFIMRLEKIFDLIFNANQRYDFFVSFVAPDKGNPVVIPVVAGLPTQR